MSKLLPQIPDTAPFNTAQRAWINGFIAGLYGRNSTNVSMPQDSLAAVDSSAKNNIPVTILFGSQTGTAEHLTRLFQSQLSKQGFSCQVVDMDDHEKIDWKTITNLLVVTSTYGEGDMPDNAQGLWRFLSGKAAPRMDSVKFSVLALGDLNYTYFCEAGIKFDQRLDELGGGRLHPRVDCDVDYEPSSESWLKGIVRALTPSGTPSGTPLEPVIVKEAPNLESSDYHPLMSTKSGAFDRKNPFPSQVLKNVVLNRGSSSKETRHFEIELKGSGLQYQPGDALGVFPENCSTLATAIQQRLGFSGNEPIQLSEESSVSLKEAFTKSLDISKPSPALLKYISEQTENGPLCHLKSADKKQERIKYLAEQDVLGLLTEHPDVRFSADEVPLYFRKLAPRLYSICSSLKAHPEEVHLTVGIVRYENRGRKRYGVCSTFLADRTREGQKVAVYVHTSKTFRLPESGDVACIMIGPGTGIAPFRAFLEEREAENATGRNWVFFGEQRREKDFYYREEFETWQKEGLLNRFDTAFSRDQDHKIYVQDRMMENAAEIYRWLEEGAQLYVCGDAARMAKDVDRVLHSIIAQQSGNGKEGAEEYVLRLKKNKKYLRDVY